MKKIFLGITVFLLALGAVFSPTGMVFADEEAESEAAEEEKPTGISISISPVSKILQLSASSVYEDSFTVTNGGSGVMNFEVYAAPYSYKCPEGDADCTLTFNNETNYTQITRWITFKDLNGSWVENPKFVAEAGESVEVSYRISTPNSIPAGGQYAVLFAHALSNSSSGSGIRTEASPGLVVYGRSSGDTITSAEISGLKIDQWLTKEVTENDSEGNSIRVEKNLNHIVASAKIKNTGNVDFNATGSLKIQGILNPGYYETPANRGRISIIPEAELTLSDEWEETPLFGLFKVTWTVTAGGETETIEAIIAVNLAPAIILIIICLTILIVWITISIKKRKERRSRFAI